MVFVDVAFPEQETHAKKNEEAILELPDWKTLLQHFKEGPKENDLKRNEDFILFNRLALVAIRRDWWKSNDSGVSLKKRNLHKTFTASDFAFALIMFGKWSADSVRYANDNASTSSSTGGESGQDGSSTSTRLKRKKLLCGGDLTLAIAAYHETYAGLRAYWNVKEKRAVVKKWNRVLEVHDGERMVKCRGNKRQAVGPPEGQKECTRAAFGISIMEDFNFQGMLSSDDEGGGGEAQAGLVVRL